MELLYEPTFYVSQSFANRPKSSKTAYIDPDVTSQSHPAFSLYLLMSDPKPLIEFY